MLPLRDHLFAALTKLAGAGDPEDNIDQLKSLADQHAQATGDVPGGAIAAATNLGGQQLASSFGTKIHELRRAAQAFAAFEDFLKKSSNPNEAPPEVAHLAKADLDAAWQTFTQTPLEGLSEGDLRRTKAILDTPANLSRLEAFASDITRSIDPAYEDLHRQAHLRQLVVPPSPPMPPAAPPTPAGAPMPPPGLPPGAPLPPGPPPPGSPMPPGPPPAGAPAPPAAPPAAPPPPAGPQ